MKRTLVAYESMTLVALMLVAAGCSGGPASPTQQGVQQAKLTATYLAQYPHPEVLTDEPALTLEMLAGSTATEVHFRVTLTNVKANYQNMFVYRGELQTELGYEGPQPLFDGSEIVVRPTGRGVYSMVWKSVVLKGTLDGRATYLAPMLVNGDLLIG